MPGHANLARMMFFSIFSAGIPSFSYIARKNSGSISPIMSNAAAELPIAPRVKMYAGIPVTAAAPKQSNWRFVKFRAILVLTLLRSFGTFTKAIVSVTENFFQRVL